MLKWPIPITLEESAIFFSGIGHFLVHYVHKIRGIGNWIPELARGIGHFKMAAFDRPNFSYSKLFELVT